MGTLSVIATPIGNLGDISQRTLDTLKEVDVLFCEDTRVTGKLLHRYEIDVEMESYSDESHSRMLPRVLEALRDGKHVGLVSDAGTPAVSDPGARLIEAVLQAEPDTRITPIPGPSATAAVMSIAGFPANGYLFMGFPPHKGRNPFWKEASESARPVVVYESPHRITKALDELIAIAPMRQVVLCRELTKMHETVYRGTPQEVKDQLESGSSKGEFVMVIAGKKK